MKLKRTLCTILVVAMLGALMLAGCAPRTDAPSAAPAAEVAAAPAAEVTAAPAAEAAAPAPEERSVTVTDMSGDEVTITGEVEKIVNLWPAGTSSFFVMGAGDLISGLAVNNPGTMNSWTKFFYADCVNIPAMGGTSPAVEEIVNLQPDLVIIHPSTAKEGFAEQIRSAGIPAININFSNYESMTQAYTILGEVLGGTYQEKLTKWCADIQAKAAKNRELTASVADADKPVVYYISGQSDSPLATMGSSGSSTTNIMQDWVETNGGIYAATVMGLTGNEVTAEQIFELDPDIIIVGGVYQHALMDLLTTADGWKDLSAVKNGKVFNNPYACFNWDRFGLESYLQLDYALMCIQPEIAAANGITRDYMVQQVIDFYKYFNGAELTAEQAGYMLDGLQADGTVETPAAAPKK